MTIVKTTAPNETDPVKKERERIILLLLKNTAPMVSDYKHTLKRTGSLMTSSMVYAYSKGIQDVIKLITKEQT